MSTPQTITIIRDEPRGELPIRIQPFEAWRFDPDFVGDAAACASPPYDQFDTAMIARLESQSPYNVARIVKAPPGGGPDATGTHYQKANELLAQWIDAGVLSSDSGPGFYPYSQTYTVGGQRLTRRGFIALGDVRDTGLFTHEETHAHVREDRARLRQATAADFGLIFMIYSDPAQEIDRILRDCEQGGPLVQAEQPDGSTHRLYRCGDPARAERVTHLMAARECVIADGHHRTGAAFDTWKQTGDERWAYAMMAFFNADAPGMTVLPIHRALSFKPSWSFPRFLERLSDAFDVTDVPLADSTPADTAALLEGSIKDRSRSERVAFGMVGPQKGIGYLLEAGPERLSRWNWPAAMHPACRLLPTAIFETGVLRASLGYSDDQIDRGERLNFPKDAAELVASVQSGKFPLGFILPPTGLDSIFEVARLRQNLPQKSTFFFPKLLTGLVVHRIGAERSD
ncbi:MAG: DUF1015 domain-containing protein [candidate division Zixibacteria bacterium]|nr:DUF1015 domain-containing protein [candidate division Zixibacteria bacterium]